MNGSGAPVAMTPGEPKLRQVVVAVPGPGRIAAVLRAAHGGADVICGTVSADVGHVLATVSVARILADTGLRDRWLG